MSIPAEAALQFLRLHEGSCSVPKHSIFADGFVRLQQAGAVVISTSSTPGYIDVYDRNFASRFANPSEY